MKKIVLIFSLFTILISCTNDITGLNENTKDPTSVPADFLFSNAEKAMVDQMVSTNVNSNVFRLFMQQWTETIYTDESNYDIATRTVPDIHFRTIYRDVLRDLVEAKKVLNNEVAAGPEQTAVLANKKAEIDIMMAYCYSVLVDTFGDVPYTQAINIQAYPAPAYDDAETIYRDLISKLAASQASMDSSYGSFGSADLIYGGDVAKWRKFANSLRLKLAINMDDIDHTYASAQALAAVTDGVLGSNADNAALKYLGTQPNTNPIYVDVIASGRDDFVPTTSIINPMNALNDPRRSQYFTLEGGTYVGGVPGDGNTFANFSHIGTTLVDPTFEGLIFDYSEVEFLLAEAVERGIAVGGTAETHYNNAVNASLSYWGVSGGDAAAYLAQPAVAYATATGTWQQKIGEQAYYALYNRGFEAWTSYRRLDFPVLIAPADAEVNQVPTRYTYPANEQTLNTVNNAAAATAIGGDLLTTKIFWDIH